MKTGREWLLVESYKLQDRRQWNCVICNLTVESAELSDHNMSMNVDMSERFSSIPGYTRPRRICDIYDFFAPFINLLTYLHRSIRWYGAARRRHLPTDIHSLHKVFTVMHPATYVTCQPISEILADVALVVSTLPCAGISLFLSQWRSSTVLAASLYVDRRYGTVKSTLNYTSEPISTFVL